MNKKDVKYIVVGLSFIAMLGGLYAVSAYETSEKQEVTKEKEITANGNHFYAPKVPENMFFAGEEIIFNDVDIYERMDNELVVNNFWHSNTIMTMKRAHQWMPLIQKILKEENVPVDMAYLAIIESNLKNVVSPSGAKGFWQIMEGTGKEYGLKINDEVDERYDVVKSTYVACEYLKKAHEKFGSWLLAAAAYNRGMNGIRRDLKNQQVNHYFDLSLNQETARYVFRAMAVKLIFENPSSFGFFLNEEDFYTRYNTEKIKVDTTVNDVGEWAKMEGINLKIFRKLNPWIIGKKLTLNEGDEYYFEVPKGTQQFKTIGQ